jgi:hypothetical protein
MLCPHRFNDSTDGNPNFGRIADPGGIWNLLEVVGTHVPPTAVNPANKRSPATALKTEHLSYLPNDKSSIQLLLLKKRIEVEQILVL